MMREIHICNRETEIELIKHNLEDINTKLDDIKKHIIGNGRTGLLERVSNLEISNKVSYIIIGLSIAVFGVLVVIF